MLGGDGMRREDFTHCGGWVRVLAKVWVGGGGGEEFRVMAARGWWASVGPSNSCAVVKGGSMHWALGEV